MDTVIDRSVIEKLILFYSEAFNAKDISQTVALYAQDGILMPADAPLAKGHEQIKSTFEFLLKTFNINIEFVVDEVVISGDYAFARTNSKVRTTVLANGETVSLENKELFVLHKIGGQWKISHYIFNNTRKR